MTPAEHAAGEALIAAVDGVVKAAVDMTVALSEYVLAVGKSQAASMTADLEAKTAELRKQAGQ